MSKLVGVLPGDVLVTSDNKLISWLIKLGALFTGRPALHSHIVVASHVDEAGTFWGIEARPSGVGWVDLKQYDRKWTRSNKAQPKSMEQRLAIVEYAKGLLGTPYDYSAALEVAFDAIRADALWRAKDSNGDIPAAVICSALAAHAYSAVGLKRPEGAARFVTPGDWYDFIEDFHYGD